MPDEDKPLPATAKRRGQLREEGSVVRSHDLVTVVVLATTLFGLMYFSIHIGRELADFMIACFTEAGRPEGYSSVTIPVMPFLGGRLMVMLFLFIGIVAGGAILSNVIQTGPMFVTAQFTHGFTKLNPINGIKGLFSLRKAVVAINSIVKFVVVTTFAYAAVKGLWDSPVFTRPVSVQELGNFFQQAAWSVGWRILIALIIISAIDWLYQRWQYEKDNKMSLHDVKEEMKASEGSAEIKARQKGIMRKNRSLRRQLEDMSGATIVVTNPTHYAVALRYVRDVTPTPVVVAKGTRLNALAIKERAAELGLATLENVPLARGLYKHGQVGEPIPSLYYQVVAQILADLFRRGYRSAA